MPSTGETWDQRLRGDNSFGVARLLLASFVVLEHSFFLIDNSGARGPLYVLTGGQIGLGQFAVAMFFAASGFLVADSFRRSAGIGEYLKKRARRIVPGFMVAAFLGFALLTPLVAPSGYFASLRWDLIAANTLTLRASAIEPFTSNPVPLVHGTLWTIKYELDCYLLVAVLGVCGVMATRRVLTGVLLVLLALLAVGWFLGLPQWGTGIRAFLISSPHKWPAVVPFFLVGVLYQCWAHRLVHSPRYAVTAAVLLAASIWLGLAWIGLLAFGTYVFFTLALSPAPVDISLSGRPVDLSYGVYLYGWPIQQLLVMWGASALGPWAMTAASAPFIAAAAFLSWRYVEEPFLRKVNRSVVPAL